MSKTILIIATILLAGCVSKPPNLDVGDVFTHRGQAYVIVGVDPIELQEIDL